MAVIAFTLVTALMNRDTLLKCPECGEIFKAPAMDEKRSGLGWTFAGTGVVKCPKCGISRPRHDYEMVKPGQNNSPA